MKQRMVRSGLLVCFYLLICGVLSTTVKANSWRKVNDRDTLRRIYSNTVVRGISLPQKDFDLNKVHSDWHIEYCQDGTGMLTFRGQSIPRTWRIKGNDQVCIATGAGERCYQYEQHSQYGLLFRSGLANSKQMPWGFTVSLKKPAFCSD